MVEADARHRDGANGLCGRGRVPAPAHAALEHRDVDARLGEDDHRRHGERVELGDVVGSQALLGAARVHALPRHVRGRDAVGEGLLGDRRARYLHALRVAHELGRGVERRAQPLAGQDGGRVAGGRRLAVGPGDLHALEGKVRVAELREHVLHGLEQRLDAKPERPAHDGERLVVRNLRNLKRQLIHEISLVAPLVGAWAYPGAQTACRTERGKNSRRDMPRPLPRGNR